MKSKRTEIRDIVAKAILLDCDAVLYSINHGLSYKTTALRIMKATTNEIERLKNKEVNYYKRRYEYTRNHV